MVLFILLFVFSIPSMIIYRSGGALKEEPSYLINQFSLGNLGAAHTVCKNTYVSIPVVKSSCNAGRVSKIFDYGIIPAEETSKSHCLREYEDLSCNQYIDDDAFMAKFETCLNQRECTLSGLDEVIKAPVNQTVPAKCTQGTATFFVQYACQFSNQERDERRLAGLLVSCIGVFIALFYSVYVDYMRCISKANYLDWDVKTITAGDYTVEMEIQKEMYDKFCSDVFVEANGVSKATAFKAYLRRELQKRLSEMPS